VLSRVLARCDRTQQPLEEVLYETIYREQQRLRTATLRSETDRPFIQALRHQLAFVDAAQCARLVHSVLDHYGQEISGHFDRRVCGFASRVVPLTLGALLHGGRPSRHLFDVDERILIEGDVAGLSRAAQLGTVVLVPDHDRMPSERRSDPAGIPGKRRSIVIVL
jgi:hypothetical protein